MNKVRESFEKRFLVRQGVWRISTNGAEALREIGDWLKEFDEPDRSVVLHCDGPDKGRDTRTLWEMVTDDAIHAHSVRLGGLDEVVVSMEQNVASHEKEIGLLGAGLNDLNNRFNGLCEQTAKLAEILKLECAK